MVAEGHADHEVPVRRAPMGGSSTRGVAQGGLASPSRQHDSAEGREARPISPEAEAPAADAASPSPVEVRATRAMEFLDGAPPWAGLRPGASPKVD